VLPFEYMHFFNSKGNKVPLNFALAQRWLKNYTTCQFVHLIFIENIEIDLYFPILIIIIKEFDFEFSFIFFLNPRFPYPNHQRPPYIHIFNFIGNILYFSEVIKDVYALVSMLITITSNFFNRKRINSGDKTIDCLFRFIYVVSLALSFTHIFISNLGFSEKKNVIGF
jgi:hypothetical protein